MKYVKHRENAKIDITFLLLLFSIFICIVYVKHEHEITIIERLNNRHRQIKLKKYSKAFQNGSDSISFQ